MHRSFLLFSIINLSVLSLHITNFCNCFIRPELSVLKHDLVDFTHRFEAELDYALYDNGTFYFVYFKGFTDDSLDELDFVEENLVFFCQTSQHECFALLVELTSKWEKLS